MKKIIIFFTALTLFNSCEEKKAAQTTETNATSVSTASGTEKAKPEYLNSVKYTEWEIGDPANIKTAMDFYTAWNQKDIKRLGEIFSDTVRLRIPEERGEIMLTQDNLQEALENNRGLYTSTETKIISAVSLHDRESNEDWVTISVYNKWTEKSGKRDSLLYNDNWRLKNGKIAFLMSYEKLPTRTFLKNNDPAK